jgi:2-polyprenyl-3-methyl-5-hydroxy-6-metoxy-1,4-benzoquinol methylase
LSANPIDRVDPRLLDSAADEIRRRDLSGNPFEPLLKGRLAEAPPAPPPYRYKESIEVRLLERLAESGGLHSPQIGDIPPRPDTFRGRVGAVLVAVVRRMLFWYTGQIRAFQTVVRDAAREQLSALQLLAAEQQRQSAALEEIASGLAEARDDERWKVLAAQEGRLSRIERSIDSRINQIERGQTEVRREVQELRREAQKVREDVNAAGIPHWAAILRAAQETGARLTALESHIDALDHELACDLNSARPVLRRRRSTEWRLSTDTLFTEHASKFRGDPDDIRSRLTIYAPYAKSAFAGTGGAPAIDLGSGRGEWLDILRENGILASGIDANEAHVMSCRSRGLQVAHGELIEFLQGLPTESHSLVTGFHIVEHLSFPDLLEVLDQTRRVLKPGGTAIFETPRPRNLFTSAHNFYLDPTHRSPLPTELLVFLVEARGLRHIETLALHPYPNTAKLPAADCPAVRFINENFYGPQDYCVVASKD